MTTQTLESLKGSFSNAIVLTPDNIEGINDYEPNPLDMWREIWSVIGETEDYILFAKHDEVSYCYFPSVGRGGVCTNGYTEWTDCDGLDDLEDRWNNYDDRWCN